MTIQPSKTLLPRTPPYSPGGLEQGWMEWGEFSVLPHSSVHYRRGSTWRGSSATDEIQQKPLVQCVNLARQVSGVRQGQSKPCSDVHQGCRGVASRRVVRLSSDAVPK